jgi:polyferredoxin
MKQKIKLRFYWVKPMVQGIVFLFVLLLVMGQYAEQMGIPLPWSNSGFHALCPFGGVETLGRIITQGSFIPKTHASNVWLLISISGLTLLFGSLFCGWLCPLGSIQEWTGKLGKRIWGRFFNNIIPAKLDKALSYLRYIMLVLIIVKTTQLISLVFNAFDPYYALFHFWTGDVLPSAIVVLGLVLLASFFIERPWCRWFCPFGAFLGVIQLLSPWKIRRNEHVCTNCTRCSKVCPMKIDITKREAVYDTRCNRCGTCLTTCAVKGGIGFSLPRNRISINNALVTGLIALVLFFIPLTVFQATDIFHNRNRVEVREGGLDIEEIKPSMTIAEVAAGLDIGISELLSRLNLPDTIDHALKVRDLEDIVEGLTVKSVRKKLSAL